MFAARGLEVSLAFFLVVYIPASFAVCAAWELVSRFFPGQPNRQTANLLFALRVFPFGLAVLLTATFGVPSYWLLEPRTSSETVGMATQFLGAGCMLMFAIGAARAAHAQRQTARAIASWLRGSSRLTLSFGSLTHEVGLIFTLGTVPLTIAALFTVGFTLPSYELLDSRVSDEGICLAPLILAAGCLLIMSVGIARALLAKRETMCSLGEFPQTLAGPEGMVPVFQTHPNAPTLTVAGIRAPKVLVSESALAALSEAELQGALRHEVAHVDAHDNLKKLLLRFVAFPWMTRLERAWCDAAEMAADDAAVSSLPQALDLASALIKVSRITAVQQPELATGFLQGPAGLSARVQRLFAWKDARLSAQEPRSWYIVPPALVAVACVIAFYSPALVSLHAFTEWLLF